MKAKNKQCKLGVREATYEKYAGFAATTQRKISDVADLAITRLIESEPDTAPATAREDGKTEQAQTSASANGPS